MSVERVGCRDILKELFRTPSWSCTFPYNLSKEGFRVSLIQSFIGIGLPVVLTSMYFIYPSTSMIDSNDQSLLQIMDFFAVSFRIVLQVSLVPWLLLNAKNLNSILDDLNTFDVYLSADGIPWKFTVRYYEDLLCLFLVLSPALMTLLLEDHTPSRIVTECLHSASPFLIFSAVVYIRRLVLLMSSAFETLGKHPAFSSSDPNAVDAALLHFDILYGCSSTLADVFSIHLFLLLGWSFFSGVMGFYFTHKYVTEKAELYEIVKQLTVTVTCFSVYFLLVSPCAVIHKKVKDFDTVLYQMLLDDNTVGIAKKKRLRLHIEMKREVTLNACGFFTLDYTLVHSIIADQLLLKSQRSRELWALFTVTGVVLGMTGRGLACFSTKLHFNTKLRDCLRQMMAGAATYLVILIQFGQPSNN